MVWSNDLAKLKQSLKADEEKSVQAPKQAPKPKPQPAQASKSLQEEDEMFLVAMGRAAATAHKAEAAPDGDGFGKAMQGLGGVKPLGEGGTAGQAKGRGPEHAPHHGAGHAQAEKKAETPAPTLPSHREATLALFDAHDGADGHWAGPAAEHGATHHGPGGLHTPPERIHLAAGMTIEVDSVLDLRKHNEADAAERLKERVLDGSCLGWRVMHVILGNSEPLRRVLLDYVESKQAHPLAKYGEAPVPMGGPQAWILYFGHVPVHDLDHEAAKQ